MPRRATILAAIPMLLAAAAAASQESPEPAPEDLGRYVTRVFRPQHVDVKALNGTIRSVAAVRKVAVDEESQSYIVRATPGEMEIIEDLVGRLDVPRSAWQLDVVALTPAGDVHVREPRLDDEVLVLQFGQGPGDHFRLRVDVSLMSEERLLIGYALGVRATGRRSAPLEYSEEGTESLAPGGEMLLVTAGTPEQREALGRLLGVEGPVHAVKLTARPLPMMEPLRQAGR